MIVDRKSNLTPEQEELYDLRDEVYDLRNENTILRRENRHLKAMYEAEAFIEYVFPPDWKLRPQESLLLSFLLCRNGVTATHNTLMVAIALPGIATTNAVLKATMCTMKKKIRPLGLVIHNEHGRGYRIDPSTRDNVMKFARMRMTTAFSPEDDLTSLAPNNS